MTQLVAAVIALSVLVGITTISLVGLCIVNKRQST